MMIAILFVRKIVAIVITVIDTSRITFSFVANLNCFLPCRKAAKLFSGSTNGRKIAIIRKLIARVVFWLE